MFLRPAHRVQFLGLHLGNSQDSRQLSVLNRVHYRDRIATDPSIAKYSESLIIYWYVVVALTLILNDQNLSYKTPIVGCTARRSARLLRMKLALNVHVEWSRLSSSSKRFIFSASASIHLNYSVGHLTLASAGVHFDHRVIFVIRNRRAWREFNA